MLKHVGEIANTGKRCAIVFLQLPEDPGFALIVETETLPERYHQPLMGIIESIEGQNSQSLADILTRRLMPDTGRPMLQTLHEGGFLQRVSVDNVNLLPRPNQKHPLRAVLEAMGQVVPAPTKPAIPSPVTNFYQDQQANQSADERASVAAGLLQQAGLLLNDAKRLQEQAYQLSPQLRPATEAPTAPVTTLDAVPETPKAKRASKKATAE